jgi:hypothetical protein
MNAISKPSVRVVAFLILLLVVVPVGYLKLLEAIVPHSGLRLSPGWEDNTFNTWYQNHGWLDDNFEEGWTIVWELGQSGNSSGFAVLNKTLILYATFDGYNVNHECGVSGIMIQKNVGGLDTRIFPFLVIKHKESSSDSALMFSFGVTDAEGVWHDGGWYHTSSSWTYLEFDLRKLYNGTIRNVSLRLTNDFDPNYAGGIQSASIQLVGFYEDSPDWILAYNKPVNATITSEAGVLRVAASGNLSGTTVAAQRLKGLTFNPTVYNYLKVSIMTSSVNVAARIVVWSDPNQAKVVLLKTYNDSDWHTEIIDLNFFSFSHIYMIELSMTQVYPSNESHVLYKQLSFNRLGV